MTFLNKESSFTAVALLPIMCGCGSRMAGPQASSSFQIKARFTFQHRSSGRLIIREVRSTTPGTSERPAAKSFVAPPAIHETSSVHHDVAVVQCDNRISGVGRTRLAVVHKRIVVVPVPNLDSQAINPAGSLHVSVQHRDHEAKVAAPVQLAESSKHALRPADHQEFIPRALEAERVERKLHRALWRQRPVVVDT